MRKFRFPLITLLLLIVAIGCTSDSNDDRPDGPDGSVDPNRPQAVDTLANLQSTGDSAQDLLSNDSFSKMRVEIAYVNGFRPTEEAMQGFVAYLKERTFKEDVEVIYNELPSPDEEKLTLEEIADLEKKNRTVYNSGDTLAVYIYFADAPAEEDDEEEGLVTLGAVFRNTSMIIHEGTVRRLAAQSVFISDADVENSTLNHEFGHLFGLVNLGTPMVNDHEGVRTDEDGEPITDDTNNPLGNSHCNVDGCLMSAELQFGGPSNKNSLFTAKNQGGLEAACRLSGKSVLKMLSSRTAKGESPAPNLDSECLLDLRSNGGR